MVIFPIESVVKVSCNSTKTHEQRNGMSMFFVSICSIGTPSRKISWRHEYHRCSVKVNNSHQTMMPQIDVILSHTGCTMPGPKTRYTKNLHIRQGFYLDHYTQGICKQMNHRTKDSILSVINTIGQNQTFSQTVSQLMTYFELQTRLDCKQEKPM